MRLLRRTVFLAHAPDKWIIIVSYLIQSLLLQARKVFQNEVFAPLIENPLFQEHLALTPGQRV